MSTAGPIRRKHSSVEVQHREMRTPKTTISPFLEVPPGHQSPLTKMPKGLSSFSLVLYSTTFSFAHWDRVHVEDFLMFLLNFVHDWVCWTHCSCLSLTPFKHLFQSVLPQVQSSRDPTQRSGVDLVFIFFTAQSTHLYSVLYNRQETVSLKGRA